jgi:hypothetical protein
MLQARAEDIDARSRAVDDKLAKATALLRNAMQLESQFADRVTNPERMGKTGEPLCVLLPAHNKMVCPCFALCIPSLGVFVFCILYPRSIHYLLTIFVGDAYFQAHGWDSRHRTGSEAESPIGSS